MATGQDKVREASARIEEIDAASLLEALASEAAPVVVDVREPHEVALGKIPRARCIPRGMLELEIETSLVDRDVDVVVVCAGGVRSALAAATMLDLGYPRVRSLAGGMRAWSEAGGAVETSSELRPDQRARYQRHLTLPEVGAQGQRALLDARVLCVGAGGLGSPAALYLAAAGVGRIGIVDDDVVEASNLQRQVLHCQERVGVSKVASAELTLRALNPDVDVVTHFRRLDSENVAAVAAGYDLIVDGSDDFATRLALNEHFVATGTPVVHASIHRFEGQLTSFIAGGPCYRCLFPTLPGRDASPSCAEAGVLGVLPGILGTLQATEAIKILLGIGEHLSGRLFVFDALGLESSAVRFDRRPGCAACGPASSAKSAS